MKNPEENLEARLEGAANPTGAQSSDFVSGGHAGESGFVSSMNGYVKTHRSIVDWRWFKGDNHVYKVFTYLILMANFKDNIWNNISIKRGQLLTGRNQLSSALGLSVQVVRTCLDKLKSTGEISILSFNKYSIISIINYECYQNDYTVKPNQQINQQETSGSALNVDGFANGKQQINQESNQQLTSNQPATNQQLTTTEECKECIEGKEDIFMEKNKSSKFIPPTCDECVDYGSEISLPMSEVESFYDYFIVRNWKLKGGAKMSDWKAAMRNWKRNIGKFNPPQTNKPKPNTPKFDPAKSGEFVDW